MNRLSALLSGARIILLLVGIGLVIWSTRLYPTLPITMSPSEADWAAIILGTGWSLTWWLFARRESFRLPVPQWLAVVPRWFTVTSTVAGGALASYRLLALWAGSTQVTIPQPGRLTAGLAILALTGAATCDATVKISGSNPGNPLKQILKPSSWLGGLASLLALALITGMMWQLTPKLIAATAAPGTELYPDLPQAVTGEVAWVKVLDGASFDGEPGLRGPIIVQKHGITALDADGNTLWERHRTNLKICELNLKSWNGKEEKNYLLTSSDRHFAMVNFCSRENDRKKTKEVSIIEILDTATGEVAAAETTIDDKPMDSVGLSSAKALAGFRLLGSDGTRYIDEVEMPQQSGSSNSSNPKIALAKAQVADASEPSRTAELRNLLVNKLLLHGGRLRVPEVNGWVAQATQTPGTTEPDSYPHIQAYSLTDGRTIPLGQFNDIDGASRTRLVLRRDDQVAVFDPSTGGITDLMPPPADLPDSLDIQDLEKTWPTSDLYAITWGMSDGPHLRLHRPGTSTDIPADLPAATPLLVDWRILPDTWAAPGCVITQSKARWFTTSQVPDKTFLACVR